MKIDPPQKLDTEEPDDATGAVSAEPKPFSSNPPRLRIGDRQEFVRELNAFGIAECREYIGIRQCSICNKDSSRCTMLTSAASVKRPARHRVNLYICLACMQSIDATTIVHYWRNAAYTVLEKFISHGDARRGWALWQQARSVFADRVVWTCKPGETEATNREN